MADAYDFCVKANRLGKALGEMFDDGYRQKLSAKIANLLESGDLQTLTDLMTDVFDSNNVDVIDVINYLRNSNNSLEYRTSVGYSFAAGVRGPIKRPWR